MARILLANDDGITSPGLIALADALLADGHDLQVCAPDRERSAQSHALTIHKPLRARQIKPRWWSISGTPADCVYLGLHHLLAVRPELVVSGINRGGNVGHDVYYSGTVAAAMEAAMSGVPAIAVSLAVETGGPPQWAAAVGVARRVVGEAVSHGIPSGVLLNVNVPNLGAAELRGVRGVRQGARRFAAAVDARTDPRGKPYYWLGGDSTIELFDDTCDGGLLRAGWATVTPIRADMTAHDQLDAVRAWTDG
jgi:5'-nucleotidase